MSVKHFIDHLLTSADVSRLASAGVDATVASWALLYCECRFNLTTTTFVVLNPLNASRVLQPKTCRTFSQISSVSSISSTRHQCTLLA